MTDHKMKNVPRHRRYPVIGVRVSVDIEKLYRTAAEEAGIELSVWIRETLDYRIIVGKEEFRENLENAIANRKNS